MFILVLSVFISGCVGGYSIREQAIRTNIPDELRAYTNGPVAEPSDMQIQQAIALGAASRDKDTLDYAYMTKAPRGMFTKDQIYVKVSTPLYLIARHAREQAREYRKVDDDFVGFVRSLHAVRISMIQQYINTATWDTLAFQRQVMLLRDGLRVEPLVDIQAWGGRNPFADKPSKEMQAALSGVASAAAQYSRGLAATMTRDQKERVLRSYQAMGLSEDQMATYTGFSHAEIREILASQIQQAGGKVALSEFDAVFPIEEVIKPGRYEIVFRTPQIASLYAHGDKEIRFPISFSNFR